MNLSKRDENTMMELILKVAQDNNIRGAIMNGSRVFGSSPKDNFQDYDIIYLVNNVENFVTDRTWINKFGEICIMQKPDLIDGAWPSSKDKFTYLMLFQDNDRIDLTFLQKDKYLRMHKDSRSLILLDKDKDLGNFVSPSDKDYLPQKPTEKDFLDCCNEFYWVATYVAKGICRKELLYTKYMLNIIRQELIKLLTWYAAIKTEFKVNFGMCSKYLPKYLDKELWDRFCKTYVDDDYAKNWSSLITMCDIFHDIALSVSTSLNYKYLDEEYAGVTKYLNSIKPLVQD